MPPDGKLIYLAAFDRDEDGELVPVFERQIESLHEAVDEAREIADQHDGVIAWVRKAALTCANTVPQKSCFGRGIYLSENCENMLFWQQEDPPDRNVPPSRGTPTNLIFNYASYPTHVILQAHIRATVTSIRTFANCLHLERSLR